MEHYQTWRDLLATVIARPRERTRLAKAIGVTTQTLHQWAMGEECPRTDQCQRLLQALPQHTMLLRTLLAEEGYDPVMDDAGTDAALLAFSARVFEIHASSPDESRYWSICNAVLAEAVQQLDPRQTGLSLSVIQCMAFAPGGMVRSLRESAVLGTTPWSSQMALSTRFFGAESLVGCAIAQTRALRADNLRQEASQADHWPDDAVSAMALPIVHSGRVAGCLLASSTQADFFARAERVLWLQNYAALLTLAFAPEEFYPSEQVDLQPMPSFQEQRPYLAGFQRRLLATLKTAFSGNRALSYLEAQQYVWSQIAEELLQVAAPR